MDDGQELDAAELEHIIGFTGQELHAIAVHSQDTNVMLYGIGHVVVLADQTDPHKQDLLRGHDNDITSVTFSPTVIDSLAVLAGLMRARREGYLPRDNERAYTETGSRSLCGSMNPESPSIACLG